MDYYVANRRLCDSTSHQPITAKPVIIFGETPDLTLTFPAGTITSGASLSLYIDSDTDVATTPMVAETITGGSSQSVTFSLRTSTGGFLRAVNGKPDNVPVNIQLIQRTNGGSTVECLLLDVIYAHAAVGSLSQAVRILPDEIAVPEPTSADAGKVIGVNNAGEYDLVYGGGGGGGLVNDVKVNGTSVVANKVATITVAAVALSGSYNDLSNKPTLSTVATSGSYNDLTNKPSIPSIEGLATETYVQNAVAPKANSEDLADVATSGKYSDLTGKPTLANVATSGDYADLSNKPTIPTKVSDLTNDSGYQTAANVQTAIAGKANTADLATVATSGSYNDLTNKPSIPSIEGLATETYVQNAVAPKANTADLATVATSGKYTDLTNKPDIPTVNDPTITFTQGGSVKGSITLNQSGNATIAFEAGGTGSITDVTVNGTSVVSGGVASITLSTVATSGSYNDLTNKPTIPSIEGLATETYVQNAVAPKANSEDLADVATSGSYNDLSNKPTIPSIEGLATETYVQNAVAPKANTADLADVATSGKYSDLTGKPTLATVATSGDYADLSNKPTLSTVATSGSYNDLSNKPSIPTKVSDLTNDSGYQTAANVQTAIAGKANTADLATVATSGKYDDLTNKPTIPSIEGLATETYVQTAVAPKANSDDLSDVATSGDYADLSNKPTLATVATSGSYNDLGNKPTIPTVTNAITSGSTEAVTSGAVYTAIGNIESLLSNI